MKYDESIGNKDVLEFFRANEDPDNNLEKDDSESESEKKIKVDHFRQISPVKNNNDEKIVINNVEYE